jgi:Leucine Rich repeat
MRAWAPWRLRTFVVGIAVLAILMAVVSERRRHLAAHERAVAEVERLEGLVGARPFLCVVDSTRRPVLSICLNNPDVTDSDVAPLACLTELETLDLSSTKVGDAGLARLAGLTNLKELDLLETQVTDAGLAHIRGMVNLRSLNIARTRVAGPGLAHLKGLAHLRSLHLVDTRVTDSGLAYVDGLTDLEDLGLSGAITDAGLVHL